MSEVDELEEELRNRLKKTNSTDMMEVYLGLLEILTHEEREE